MLEHLNQFLKIGFCSLSTLVCAISALGYFGNFAFLFELLSHFRVVYAAVLGLTVLMAIGFKLRRWAIFFAIFFLINFVPVFYLYIPESKAKYTGNTYISIIQFNVRPYQNKNYEKVLKTISERNADVVGIIELTKDWTNKILQNSPEYPHHFKEEGFGGIMILSKYPLIDPKIQYTGSTRRPRIATRIKKDNDIYSIILAHTVTPKHDLNFRNKELKMLASEARTSKHPLIVFGDLNCSPFSYYFERLLKQGNLKDSERGFGVQCTWPAYVLPVIAIDHVLISDDLRCVERTVGPRIGSDHLPVYVKIAKSN